MKNTITIKTVKEIRDIDTDTLTGYLVDGKSVPLSDGNKDYQEVQEWLKTNTSEPAYTQAELDKHTQDKINQEARQYLADTDWYIIRLQENGIAIPQAVLDLRATARTKVI